MKIYEEIRKVRCKVKKCSSTIDGEVGSANIAEDFAGIYSKLYNQVEQRQEITNLMDSLNKKINKENIYQVNRISEGVVKQGLSRMKGSKSDAIFYFQSDQWATSASNTPD